MGKRELMAIQDVKIHTVSHKRLAAVILVWFTFPSH